jgi:hypothetical protein
MSGVIRSLVHGVRHLDRRISRRRGHRRILVDARTPMNFTMIAPVFRAMQPDPRLAFYFTASEDPHRMPAVYGEAPGLRLVHPNRAAFMKFDAYLVSDFIWAALLRETARVQMFHGVAGKYGFDAPDRSMREWHRLFFVNERRLRNFVAHGAIDADSPAIRLVGMPKVDCLVDDTYDRDAVLLSLGLDPSRPTVLYAPTWSPDSSLNDLGLELASALGRRPVNLVVKLHDRSRDLRKRYSGGIDWATRLLPLLTRGKGVLAGGSDISPYLAAADLMITDHSSAGFEFLLRDRPIVRIHRPRLLERANVHPDYVSLLASVSQAANTLDDVVGAVERGLAEPELHGAARRRVAAELFYKPGGATARAVQELYDVMELDPAVAPATLTAQEEQWPKSA